MSGPIRKMVVQLMGDTSGLQKALSAAQAHVKTSVQSIEGSGGRMNAVMDAMGSKMTAFAEESTGSFGGIAAAAGPAGLAIAAGIGLAVVGISKVAEGIKTTFDSIISAVEQTVGKIVELANETMPLYAAQQEGETKLITIMQQRMGATKGMVDAMLELAHTEMLTGVTDEDAVFAGEQQLATFLNTSAALKVLTPAMADGMEARVPNLEKLVIDNCGHWTQQEQPQQTTAAMLAYLRRLDRW